MRGDMPPPAAAKSFFATTAGIPAREKFDYWHEVVCRNLVDLEYWLAGARPFEASFSGTRIEHLNLSRIEASAHTASRSSTGIARNESESLVFNFVLSGWLISEQDGRTTRLNAGEGAFCDARRPYRLHSDDPFAVGCLQVPRHVVDRRIGDVQRLAALNLCQRSELGSLVYAYLARLIERAPTLNEANSAKVCQNFTDLLISMLGEMVDADPLPLSEYRNLALMRVKDVVERNIGNDRLGPDFVTAELKLSPRYINELLQAESTSLSRYIWQRRLERSAEQLGDPRLRCRTISVIALNNGFNDLSHFSKAFRQRYGLSPRDYRRRVSES